MDGEVTLRAEVVGQEGHCAAGHGKGDVLSMSCLRPGGLCGFFYHDLFPSLQTYEYGGRMPWWKGDELLATCPDPDNPVTIRITRNKV